ncbi:MAG: helix-hairpin-helix domain-containing protein [Myxococcota bacterium]|nr:helix-hairpin-helix domain-containing protein [Myxococcota bacterium]
MIERERAVAWAALLLGLSGWLAWLPVCAPERSPEQCVQACDGAVKLLFGEPLDLNTASAEDLGVLPGIGPVRAEAIVAERARGPFRRVEDLQAVHGIGPHTVASLEGWVRVAVPSPRG